MTNLTETELSNLTTNRASTYAFLSRAYMVEADQDFLDQISELNLTSEISETDVGAGFEQLKQFLAQRSEHTLTELAVDYARVFLGVRRGTGAFPYESVYTSKDKLLMQEARDEVLQFFREEGLDRAEDFHEPEDHIGLELEFMAYLCQKMAEALEAGDRGIAVHYLQKQERFFKAHLLNWIQSFCEDVERFAQTDFYKAVGRITQSYVALEAELLDELIKEL